MTRIGASNDGADGNGPAAPNGQALPEHERAGGSWARAELWQATVRHAAAVFARQVLLRPLRIGALILLAAAVVAVVAGAQGWWIILGVVLFQTAASALIVLWTDSEHEERPGDPPAPRSPEPDTQAEEPPEPPEPEVPGQRSPGEE